jgi:hypothetical protein
VIVMLQSLFLRCVDDTSALLLIFGTLFSRTAGIALPPAGSLCLFHRFSGCSREGEESL